MNNGLSSELEAAFPDIVAVSRPKVEFTEIPDPNWLVGSAPYGGEGSFFVAIIKSKTKKRGYQVCLKFSITQHTRDAELMRSFIEYLGCGRLEEYHQDSVQFTVTKFSDISEKIIP